MKKLNVTLLGMVLCALTDMALADTFAIDSSLSSLTLSGSISSTATVHDADTGTTNTYQNTTTWANTYSGGEGGTGNLTTALSGSINASQVFGTLQFNSSSVFNSLNDLRTSYISGGSGYYFSNQVAIGNVLDQISGNISPGLDGNITGSSTLSGSPGNLSFTTIGLSSSWLAPALHDDAFTHVVGTFGPYTNYLTSSISPSFISGGGTGTLVNNGVTETLTIPIEIVVINSMFNPGTVYSGTQTINASNSEYLALTGQIVAVRAVPEPEGWGMMLAGLSLIGWRMRRRNAL